VDKDQILKMKQQFLHIFQSLKVWAKRIKRDALALWFARLHPSTPRLAKALGIFVVAYALSPIDLIPDFIPILGYLDDVILLPVLIWLTVRLLPIEVLAESRIKAEAWIAADNAKPRSYVGAVVIVVLWFAAAGLIGWWVWGRWF
jgi:uncharacterized membrane protein YkvA (DUF1232 family)